MERRRARRDVKELFDMVDIDGSGLLDKSELAHFVTKAQRFDAVREVTEDPEHPFDLDTDWTLMRRGAPARLEGVSFPMFESWWKMRAGISDHDVIVLPEFISERLTQGNSQLQHFVTGRSRGFAELNIDDANWLPRTVWVGSIPRDHANKTTIGSIFSEVGPVQSINVRVKDVPRSRPTKAAQAASTRPEDDTQSWALVTFRNVDDAYKASKLGGNKGDDMDRRQAR